MPECPATQWIAASMLWAPRAVSCLMIALARCCPGPSSRCIVRLMAAWESLHTATVVTPCAPSASAFGMNLWSVTPISQSSWSRNSIHPMPGQLRKNVQPSPWRHTAAAHTLQSSVRDLSIHHVQVRDPLFLSFRCVHCSATLLAAASSSSIVVLTAGFSPESGQNIICALLLRT